LVVIDQKFPFCYNNGIQRKKGVAMQYTLITAQGKIMQFYILAVAQTYQALNGGVVFSQQILVEQTVQTVDQ
jgi:hypothetical protein